MTPARSAARHPWLRTAFVGRVAEAAALRDALAAGPFVAVVGPPGIGKSRLVVQTAAEPDVSGRFGPLRLCALADARDPGDVAAAFAAAAGLTLGPGSPEALTLRAVLASGRGLWLLDDADALDDTPVDLNALLERLAEAAPEARFVSTARTPPKLVGARTIRLGPLETPDDPVEAAARAPSEAVALLCAHRTAAGLPEPDDETRAALGTIARAVEGVPLALELAAARLRVTTARTLAHELSQRRAAPRGPTDGDALSAAIAWAWTHLDAGLQSAMGALAVCSGGCDRALARAVIGDASDADVAVDALLDHSWLRPAGADGERLAAFESMRRFAERATPADRLAAARDRHAAALAATWRDAPERARTPEGLAAVAAESANLAAAFAWSVGPDHRVAVGVSTTLALALDAVWTIRGPSERLEDLLTAARAAALRRPDPDPLEVARLADAEGRHAINRGEIDRAVRALDEAVTLARAAGDPALLGRALDHRACAEMFRSPAAALPLLTSALAQARRAGDRAGEGRTLSNLGICHHAEGRIDEARALLEDALVRLRAGGDAFGAANTWSVLGALYHAAPGRDLARACYDAALVIYRAAGNVRREGAVTGSLALLEQEAGHLETAAALHEAAVARLQAVDAHLFAAVYRGYRGTVSHEQGDLLAARLAYRDALARLETCGDRRFSALFAACLGVAELADGPPNAGTRTLATARARATETGDRVLVAAVELLEAASSPVEAASLAARAAPFAYAYDVRLALRLAGLAAAPPTSGPGEAPSGLVMTRDGAAFRAPGARTADLGRRLAQRRLLQRLVAERERVPGRPLSVEVLFEAGWPGDRSRRTAALNRVHVALATLRGLGLRSLLLRRGGGYLLDPEVPVTLVEVLTPEN
jgi:predicted ATPase